MALKNDKRWDEFFQLYKIYLKEEGRFPPNSERYNDLNLGNWFRNQVSAYRAGTLSHERKALMDSVNPFWHRPHDERQEENKRLLFSSNWKKHLKSGDVGIDQVFSGDELYNCLNRGIFSCRDYMNCFEEKYDNKMWLSLSEHLSKRFHDDAAFFSLDNRWTVFEAQFPNLDFCCFNIYCFAYGYPSRESSYFNAARLYSEGSRFSSADEMVDVFNGVLGSMQPEDSKVLIKMFEEGLPRKDIAKALDVSIETIRQREFRAMRFLQRDYINNLISPVPFERRLTLAQAKHLIAKNNGNLNLAGSWISVLPEDLYIPGNLTLGDHIAKWPTNLTVGGSIDMRSSPLRTLPPQITEIHGDLILSDNVLTLPKGLVVHGSLTCGAGFSEFPSDVQVDKNITFKRCPIDKLPDDFFVKGNLIIDTCRNLKFPRNLHVGGDLFVNGTYSNPVLSDGLSVAGNATVKNLYYDLLPKAMTVKGDLNILGACCREGGSKHQEALPDDLQVGGNLFTNIRFVPDHLRKRTWNFDSSLLTEAARARQISIDELHLSVRSFNALWRAHIRTVADILYSGESGLRSLRNLGSKSVDEILKKVSDLNFENLPFYKNSSVFSFLDNNSNDISSLKTLDKEADVFGMNILAKVEVEDLDLSVRAYNCLKRSGIHVLGDLLKMTESDLRGIRGLGPKVAEEILSSLNACGVYLLLEKNPDTARNVSSSKERQRPALDTLISSAGAKNLSGAKDPLRQPYLYDQGGR